MATYAANVLTTAGSTTLPIAGLIGNGSVRATIRELGIFNTTATAVDVALCRISTAGTPGSSATAMSETEGAATATAVLKNTYSSTAPTTSIVGRRAQLGAAVGSCVIWTFPDGLVIPATSNAGVGVIVGSGTGQACQVYVVWSE
jgi:hypothetical protein